MAQSHTSIRLNADMHYVIQNRIGLPREDKLSREQYPSNAATSVVEDWDELEEYTSRYERKC
jgi:hypothetical protein